MQKHHKKNLCIAILLLCFMVAGSLFSGCAASTAVNLPAETPAPTPTPSPTPVPTPTPIPTRPNEPVVLVPARGESEVYGNAVAAIDASNSSQGYIMVAYTGSNPKVKLQITTPTGMKYTYTLRGGWEVFPLTGGDGYYQCNVFENVGGTDYVFALSQSIYAEIENEFLPYLYPNQYVNFDASCLTVAKGAELAEGAMDELDVVNAVYNYVISNTTYDYAKASSVKSGYLPDVDEILSSGTGICFDYSAVMVTMLRTQQIPTRLDVGWAGDIYHAWISVYISDIGWINGLIEFDGTTWKRMDPTFACNGGQSESIMQFISNDANYNIKYVY